MIDSLNSKLVYWVAGSTGAVGRNIVEHLSGANSRVVTISRELNIINESEVSNFNNVLIICSGWAPPREDDPEKLVEGNILYLRKLLISLSKISFSHIFYLSTVSVYGKITEPWLSETTPYRNPDLYGLSKLMGEKIVLSFNKKSHIFVLRLPGVVGSGVTNAWIYKAHQKIKNSEEIILKTINTKFNNIICTKDIANLIIHISNRNLKSQIRDVFNVCSSSPVDIRILLKEMIKLLGSRSKINELSSIDSFAIDYSKISLQTGFQFLSVNEVVLEMVGLR
jgi:nucleoside-diphosphate-sugar epimerase